MPAWTLRAIPEMIPQMRAISMIPITAHGHPAVQLSYSRRETHRLGGHTHSSTIDIRALTRKNGTAESKTRLALNRPSGSKLQVGGKRDSHTKSRMMPTPTKMPSRDSKQRDDCTQSASCFAPEQGMDKLVHAD